MIESARAYQTSNSAIKAIAWSPNGQFLAIANDDQIEILDTTNNNQSVQIIQTNSPTTSIAWRPFSNNSEIATGHIDAHVHRWNITSGQELANYLYQESFGSVNSVAWSPDGTRIAATGPGRIAVKVWSALTDQLLGEVDFEIFWVFPYVYWTSENTILNVNSDGIITVIDANTFAPIQSHDVAIDSDRINEAIVFASSLSPNANLMAVAGDDRDNTGLIMVSIINMQTGQLVTSIPESDVIINSLAWSPDGSRLAIGDSDVVKVRDTSTWQLLTTITPNEGQIDELAWHPNSSMLAYSSSGNGGQGGSVTIIEVL